VHNDRPFVVMDFVSGDNLKDVIANGPQPIGRAIEIVRQVLSGLAHAHEHGIIHRDIKPANLVLSHKTGLGDHVKILDFGLARLHNTGQNLTTGMVVGTPAYMAPEQIRGHVLDHRIDLYACGVLLFELLTGAKPYHSEHDDPIEVCRHHLSTPVPRLSDKLPGAWFGELEGVVARALAKVADERFASAHDFAVALDAVAPARTSRPAFAPGPSASPSASIQLASADVMPLGDPAQASAVEVRSADVMAVMSASASQSGEATARRQAATPPAGVARPAESDLLGTFLGIAVKRTPVPRFAQAAPPAVADASAESAAPVPEPVATPGTRAPSTGDGEPARPRTRVRRITTLVGGVLVALASALLLWTVTSHDDRAPVGESGAAPGAGTPGARADEVVARANALVAQGDREGALDLLVRARKQDPDSGPLAYAAGRIYFSKFYWSDGLKSFRDALRSEPTYRTDPELIKIVLRGFIMTPSYNDELASFLRDDIGGPARSFLEETARDHPNATVRSRAAGELRRYR
jgi:serine/threonine-protein kinase